MHVRDLEDDKEPGTWAGLALKVAHPSKPRFRVEYTPQGLLRVVDERHPLLWAHWHGGFDGFSWLRDPGPTRLLPPLTASLARELAGSAPRWARALAPMLAQAGILHRGDWQLMPACATSEGPNFTLPRTISWAGQRVRAVMVQQPERALEPLDADRWEWDLDGGGWLLGLRAASRPDAGRVKAWRKLAREQLLPPLVIYFVTLLDSWLLLDGHDRLLAATLEGVTPPMMALSAVREVPIPVDAEAQARLYAQLEQRFGGAGPLEPSTTKALLSTFLAKFPGTTHTISRTRAWPIPGGREKWHAEVQERLRSATAVGTNCWLPSSKSRRH